MQHYKPLLFLFFVTFFIAVSSCHRRTVPSSSSAPASYNNNRRVDTTNMIHDILFYVNRHRQSVGLSSLKLLDFASIEAKKHSTNMAAKITPFGHDGFDARTAAISRYLGSVSAAAENVADGKLTAIQVVDGWLHSPAHKKNIEGNYALTGIGIAVDPGGILYFTQIFILK